MSDQRQPLRQGPPEDPGREAPGDFETVWKNRYGTIVIKVIDGQISVNGQWVRTEPMPVPAADA